MNKIYKVIWSKAKHTYVVASEIAKGHTKGAGSGHMANGQFLQRWSHFCCFPLELGLAMGHSTLFKAQR